MKQDIDTHINWGYVQSLNLYMLRIDLNCDNKNTGLKKLLTLDVKNPIFNVKKEHKKSMSERKINFTIKL